MNTGSKVDISLQIPIFYATDNKAAFLALVSMISVVKNTKHSIRFIILESNLDKDSINMLNHIKKYKNCKIEFRKIDENILNGFWNTKWVTIQAWFRLLIPWLYPDIKKAIYLDCDTMLVDDIIKFYNIDIENYLLAATPECVDEQHAKRLNLKNPHFFNSGVLLINCEKWKKDDLFTKVKKIVMENNPMDFGDEDVFNLVADNAKKIVYDDMIYIEPWWFSSFKLKEGPHVIIHFTGNKPSYFKCKHSLRHIWREIAKETPYYLDYLEKYRLGWDEYIKNPSISKNF